MIARRTLVTKLTPSVSALVAAVVASVVPPPLCLLSAALVRPVLGGGCVSTLAGGCSGTTGTTIDGSSTSDEARVVLSDLLQCAEGVR